MWPFLLVACLFAYTVVEGQAAHSGGLVANFSVECTDAAPGSCHVLDAIAPERWTGRAVLNSTQNSTGWATLLVETPPGIDDKIAAYSAGFIEGKAFSTTATKLVRQDIEPHLPPN